MSDNLSKAFSHLLFLSLASYRNPGTERVKILAYFPNCYSKEQRSNSDSHVLVRSDLSRIR